MATLVGSISTTGSPLTFGQGNGISLYAARGFDLGRRQWRRTTVTSPYVKGEVETNAVLEQSTDVLLPFRCRAASESALDTLVASLVAAVEAKTWDLILTVGGHSWSTMTCTRADTSVVFDVPHIRGLTATVFVFTTRNPNTSGPL